MQLQRVPVTLSSTNEKTGPGEIEIMTWDATERRRRALKTLAICWGIAIGSVIFPLIHFVVPPSMLIAGPIVAYFIYWQESQIKESQCLCPSCGKPFQVSKGRPHWPLSDVCSSCHEGIRITLR